LRGHPAHGALEHRDGHRILGVEIVIEARFADADLVGDILEAEAVETLCLDEPLGGV
jgi:hypothetical protein